MNRSKIEWCDHTLNIVTGCLNGCPYCYARNLSSRSSGDHRYNQSLTERYTVYRLPDGGPYAGHALYELDQPFLGENGKQVIYPFGFEPTFHRYRLGLLDNLKGGHNVFVGAMADLFGPWVPEMWIRDVIGTCEAHPKNNYLFLTKFPETYQKMEAVLPETIHFWYGTTVTCNADMKRISCLPGKGRRYISFEPLHESILLAPEDWAGIDWVIIGAETGRSKEKVVPEYDWVRAITLRADVMGIPVFMKDSLIPLIGEKNLRREFPEILLEKPLGDKREQLLYADCLLCRRRFKRNEMVTFSAKVGRSGGKRPSPIKTICTLCRECYEAWSKEHGLENHAPELYGEKGIQEEVE